MAGGKIKKGVWQKLEIDTITGRRHIYAPDGWVFDKTAIHAWRQLVIANAEQFFKRRRDKDANDGRREALACLLANAVGMAAFYWDQEAERLVKEGKDGTYD